jgi:hypothetical protein
MASKVCVTCGLEKETSLFVHRDGKILGQCKECRNNYIKQYKLDRQNGMREKTVVEVINEGKVCKMCNTWKPLKEFPSRKSAHGYRHECKECRQANVNEYYQTTYNAVRRERKKTDIQYRLLCNHRHYVYKCLTRYSLKCQSSIEYIGCSVLHFKKWLEFMFTDDMTWDNYNTVWTIDHVIPLSLFDLNDPQQQLVAFHWSNMHPSTDNFKKGNKFRLWEYMNVLISASRFIRTNAYSNEWYQGLRESLNWLRKNSDMVIIH